MPHRLWKFCPKGSYILGVDNRSPIPRGQHEISLMCFLFCPCCSNSCQWVRGALCSPWPWNSPPALLGMLSWGKTALVTHSLSQSAQGGTHPVSSPLPKPLRVGSGPGCSPSFENVWWRYWGHLVAWWGHQLEPSQGSRSPFHVPFFPPRSNSSMFLQPALPSHVWHSKIITHFRMITPNLIYYNSYLLEIKILKFRNAVNLPECMVKPGTVAPACVLCLPRCAVPPGQRPASLLVPAGPRACRVGAGVSILPDTWSGKTECRVVCHACLWFPKIPFRVWAVFSTSYGRSERV